MLPSMIVGTAPQALPVELADCEEAEVAEGVEVAAQEYVGELEVEMHGSGAV